jgi:hypothetical protein
MVLFSLPDTSAVKDLQEVAFWLHIARQSFRIAGFRQNDVFRVDYQ